jgi:type I restriction enzyme M protein
MHFTLEANLLKQAGLDEFVECYRPQNRHRRKPTWSEKTPDGRWPAFDYDELLKRDKVDLDAFRLKDKSPEGYDDLPGSGRPGAGERRRPPDGAGPFQAIAENRRAQ